MNIAIIEDRDDDAKILIRYLTKFETETGTRLNVTRFTDGINFVSDYKPVYDIVFFDIMMPMMSGMEAAQRIRSVDESVTIIFITNMPQYAIDGYAVNAIDFMLKPIAYSSFRKRFSKAIKQSESSHRRIMLIVSDDDGQKVRIFAQDVYYITKERNYVYFHSSDGVYKKREELKTTLQSLRELPFSQLSSGVLVNLARIESMTASTVTVNGEILPIARARKKALIESYMNYLGE